MIREGGVGINERVECQDVLGRHAIRATVDATVWTVGDLSNARLEQSPDDVQLSGNALSYPVVHALEAFPLTHLRQPRPPDRPSNSRQGDHRTSRVVFPHVITDLQPGRETPRLWVGQHIEIVLRRNG